MAFSKYVITTAGRNLLLSCMASGDFRIEKLVLGSGRYGGILTEIQDVVEPVAEFSGDALVVSRRENQLEVRCRLSNEQLEQGFEWREYGLYATDGTNSVLYCYDNAGEEPVPITAAATGAGISNTIKLILGIEAAATVHVNFQPAPDFVLDDVVTQDGGHAVTGAAVHAFAGGGIPKPTEEDAGKALTVDETGAYVLGVKPATAAFYDVVIPLEGWSAAAPYSVEIPMEGILASDTPIVDIVQSGVEETDALIREAWVLVTRIVPGDGGITVYAAEEIPAVEIPIHMVVIR